MTITEEKNSEAPDLKHPRFVVDHSVKHVVNHFLNKQAISCFVEQVDLENRLL